MENEFVPYELALRMKRLGFDESCFRYYWERFENSPRMMNQYGSPKSNSNLDRLAKTELKGLQGKSYCSAPTWQSAFRWFREKYSMYHQIHKGYGWEGIVRESNNNESILWHDGTYNSPEEAELACLKKLIEIVENK